MTSADKPGVVAFPGVLYAVAFVVAYGLNLAWRIPVLPQPLNRWVGVALGLAGAGLILWGIASMRRAGTNIYPEKPATALVEAGPFRFTRNPLYVALTILFAALSVEMNMAWGFVILVPLNAANRIDRKSTRLNSSHQIISYAVFCLKKKTKSETSSRAPSAGRCI